jgi:hypothetical protein
VEVGRCFDAYYNCGAVYEAESKPRNALADSRKYLEFIPGDAGKTRAIERVKKKM